MTLWNKSMAELTSALKTARGAKRVKILRELQKRWDELTARHLASGPYERVYIIPRFDFELYCG